MLDLFFFCAIIKRKRTMTTENHYTEVSPEESFVLSLAVLIGLTAFQVAVTSIFVQMFSITFWIITSLLFTLSLVWIIRGYIKRPVIKPNQIGALKILGRATPPYIFTGEPWVLLGVMSFEIRTVGENNLLVDPIELSAGTEDNAQVKMQMKIKIRYIISNIFTEISITEGSGLDLLGDLAESSARELIAFNTDEELMRIRSIPSEKENIRQQIWDKIAKLDPDKDTKKDSKGNHPIDVPIEINVWGITVLGVFVHDIMPADKDIVDAYASVRKDQLRAKGETVQTQNLRKNARALKDEFPDLSGKDALRTAQLEDRNPGIKEIIISGGEVGDFSKAALIKDALDSGKKKEKD